ncbi:hypothetical protein BGZ94_008748 [Podila epigama]|nr:hypothetical protein BGZ94_008748 [Podila epigama]
MESTSVFRYAIFIDSRLPQELIDTTRMARKVDQTLRVMVHGARSVEVAIFESKPVVSDAICERQQIRSFEHGDPQQSRIAWTGLNNIGAQNEDQAFRNVQPMQVQEN